MFECPHKMPGYLATKFIWMRGVTYMICKMCGADVRGLPQPKQNVNKNLN